MMVNELDAVTAALGSLRHAGSPGLTQRVFTGWLSAPSRLGEVFVAFTRDGVQFVRPADSVGGDPETFAEAYRRRFARPLHHADRGPAGLLPTLRGRCGAAPRLDLSSLTAFERDVLTVTRNIPTGRSAPTAGWRGEAGHPTAVRAVASVLGRNPVPLLLPCHRVVRSDGALGGYMFGPARKNELLQGEGTNLDDVADFALTWRALPGQRHHRRRLLSHLPPRPPHHLGASVWVRHGRRRCRRRLLALPVMLPRPGRVTDGHAPVAAAGTDSRSADDHHHRPGHHPRPGPGSTGPNCELRLDADGFAITPPLLTAEQCAGDA